MSSNQLTTDSIRFRYSCRSYNGSVMEKSSWEKMEDYIAGNSESPFGTKTRFINFAGSEENKDILKGLGTYGFIKGASAFIVGVTNHEEYSLEDFGYLMEKNILYATTIGLGTCWLGGSFKKSVFSQRAEAGENEYVPAVAAVGNIASKRRLAESALRFSISASKRIPFPQLFFNKAFGAPLYEEGAGAYKVPLEMVQKAPSASNKQPWRIVCDLEKGKFDFYLHRTKKYYKRNKKMFGLADMQRIDMGIAMCHFEIAANELNIKGFWKVNKLEEQNLPEGAEYLVSWEAK